MKEGMFIKIWLTIVYLFYTALSGARKYGSLDLSHLALEKHNISLFILLYHCNQVNEILEPGRYKTLNNVVSASMRRRRIDLGRLKFGPYTISIGSKPKAHSFIK